METEGLIICRCEEVTQREILEVLQAGGATVNEVKRLSRAGMGLCQGKICCRLVSRIVASHTGRPIAEVEQLTARPPVRPIPMGVLAQSDQ